MNINRFFMYIWPFFIPHLERLDGCLMTQSPLWNVAIIDVEISVHSLFEIF